MEILALHLFTDSIEETTTFYTTVMQFPILSKTEQEVIFKVGNATLGFSYNPQIVAPAYHFAFAIPFEQVNQAKLWYSQKVSLLSYQNEQVIDFENWKAKAIYFYDTNGNILECIGREDLHTNCEAFFTEQSILGISEIGLIAEYPQELAEQLHTKLGCAYFQKGPNREDFVAMGNDHGLFVISNNKRNWFPTQDKATAFPLSVKVKLGNVVTEVSFN